MTILESLLTLITKFFSVLGATAGALPCGGFFDEPEVPSEITKLHE
ncbi:cyclic lactone autoinducer peptide [Staphylococcus succinus]|uniref:AgrD n=1 Tax=Staphylococcus succinus TaxID=61015 RepID=A0A8F9W6D1_9STAP|nr:cyclic lactone autoinducer peptide [Staphylococcus succinus]PTJ80937.1 cyclic lactone autoinducer peptide [Staphylococcus succinus]QYJ10205.1 AgrD [Staphylococcus succinus]